MILKWQKCQVKCSIFQKKKKKVACLKEKHGNFKAYTVILLG